jgi:uncharacterized membrane protein
VALSIWLGLAYSIDAITPFIVWIVAVFVYLVVSFALYLPKHFAMRCIKVERGWDAAPAGKPEVILTDTVPPARDVVSPLWLLLFPLVIVLTLGAVWLVWPQVPDPVPIHFNLKGVADTFVDKGPLAVAPLIITQLILAVVFVFVYFIVRHAKRQIDATNPVDSRLRDMRFRRLLTGSLIGLGAALDLMMGIAQVGSLVAVWQWEWALLSSLILLAVVAVGMGVFAFRVGQGGSRLHEPRRHAAPAANTNIDDDRFWKLGQFYFNPSDPAVIVEKRFGLGYTCNFARPAAWLLIGGFLVFIIACLILVFLFAKNS